MNLAKSMLASAVALCTLLPAKGEIVINEVMQSNIYSIMDDLNDFPDSWVELYNTSDEAVNLNGYRLHTKDKFKSAYELPHAFIEPGGVLLIYCDKVGEGLHADFRVDSGKGDVILFDAEGNIVDKVSLKKQPAPEVAYGRATDGSDEWGYELTPTPGATNGGGHTETVLGNVKFSVSGGVWSNATAMEVALTLPKNAPEGAEIIYTTDGTEPTIENSTVYEAPIAINANTVLRAKAVAEGCISIPSDVQSYIFLDRDFNLPVVSIVVDEKYLYDDEIGILADGTGGDLQENWRNNWRRPINLEYFAAEGAEAAINQLCETRVQGGLSRTNVLKSLAVYANKRFGVKNFGYELWPEDKPGVNASKSFILRNAGNDFDGCYMRDGLIQRVIGRNTEVDWQGYSPVIVFINGEYHAMLALRERSNEDNVAANYDGLEDIDMFENWEELKAGDEAALDEFKEFVYAGHSFDEWKEYINIESYANLMAINYWVYNSDFPMNNVVMWRRTDGVDGRWQWLVKDCDYGLGIWNEESFMHSDFHHFMYSNVAPYVGFDIYQNLMHTEFKYYFIDRLIAYMGDFMNAETFRAYADEILDKTYSEMVISHAKWGSTWSNLDRNIDFMKYWIDAREEYMPTLMQESWGLGKPVKVSVNVSLSDDELNKLDVHYNGVPLTKNMFNGYDYMGRDIVLTGDAERIEGWEVTKGDITTKVMDSELSITIDSDGPLMIKALLNETGIENVNQAQTAIKMVSGTVYADGVIEAYDMAGRKVGQGLNSLTLPAKGVYVVRANGNTAKIAW